MADANSEGKFRRALGLTRATIRIEQALVQMGHDKGDEEYATLQRSANRLRQRAGAVFEDALNGGLTQAELSILHDAIDSHIKRELDV